MTGNTEPEIAPVERTIHSVSQSHKSTAATNRTAVCEELSADNVTQIPAATHRCHCPNHPTETTETHFQAPYPITTVPYHISGSVILM